MIALPSHGCKNFLCLLPSQLIMEFGSLNSFVCWNDTKFFWSRLFMHLGRNLIDFLALCFRASSTKECDINGAGLWCTWLFSGWSGYHNLVLCCSGRKAWPWTWQNAWSKLLSVCVFWLFQKLQSLCLCRFPKAFFNTT